ncbi:hepatic lectin-like [Arapaima gigas]
MLIPSPLLPGSCESLWLPFQSSCYLVSFKRVSWHEAENSCNQLGAHLMVVNDEDEQVFIYMTNLLVDLWIGLVERGEEGNWTWVDGTNFNTTPHFWEKDQPDNWHEVENGEDCGQLHHGMYWNDADCSAPFSYICEKEAD